MTEPARAWADLGTELFLSSLRSLDDESFAAPSALPGWTRAHLVAHVHYNAQALMRLVRWAGTGIETPMYASAAQRSSEITDGATLAPGSLRELVTQSAIELARAFDELDDESWTHEVVTAQGRRLPATELPWLRTREVAVHAVDLRVGTSFNDLPDPLLLRLAHDVLTRRASTGELADITGWLTGRQPVAPTIGAWL